MATAGTKVLCFSLSDKPPIIYAVIEDTAAYETQVKEELQTSGIDTNQLHAGDLLCVCNLSNCARFCKYVASLRF